MVYPVYVFDAYGTLFDVHAAARAAAGELGAAWAQVSADWRAKQLEYSWTETLMGRFPDFWTLTERALDHALAAANIADAPLRAKLLDAYRTLEAYPEVAAVLAALRAQGAKTAILSNATPDMLDDAIGSAGLAPHLDAVLSVAEVGRYKVAAPVYRLAVDRLGTDRISFQSSNAWDAAGAAHFGFRVCWINRLGAPAEYPECPPAKTLTDLTGLLAD